MLVANMLIILARKSAWNSGKRSLALPLQHCDLQFFDISEIAASERVGKEVDFKHLIPCVF